MRNTAQRWCFETLMDIEASVPFPLLGLDSDNWSEFINDQLFRYCTDRGITFTRSRPYRKNHNCFVDQKNWPVVRQNVGYARYFTPEELEALNELYAHVAVRELLPATDEASLQCAWGSQGSLSGSTGPHPLPATLASPGGPRGRQGRPRVLEAQPR